MRPFRRLTAIVDEYPRNFWTLVGASFIDHVGGALLFPFFTLYLTSKFNIGMTTVGLIFLIFTVSGMIGSTFGGALADRMGRKAILLFSLVFSALSTLWMGSINNLDLFFPGAVIIGLLSDVGGPARQAMVADLLPEEQRADGFGILRVTLNLAVTIGPAIGGLLAAQSYMLLFISDAVTSIITAVIIFLILPETRPVGPAGETKESMLVTFAGYGKVIRDRFFMVFIGASILMVIVYSQMNSTLGVYLRDIHSVPEQGFGYILSLNAAMVVIFQFAITRRITKYPPMIILAVGSVLYSIGFAMYGWVSNYSLFLLAMVIITVGEMLQVPVSQALVARIAPEDMRGRYMAVFGLSWAIPFAIGPLLAGLIMDYGDPHWVWFGAGIVGMLATTIFVLLQRGEETLPESEPSTA
ncbi:MAG: MFS transporter [Anaerolineales bacterium]